MTEAGNASAGLPARERRAGCWSCCLSRWRSTCIVVGSVAGAVWRFRAPPPGRAPSPPTCSAMPARCRPSAASSSGIAPARSATTSGPSAARCAPPARRPSRLSSPSRSSGEQFVAAQARQAEVGEPRARRGAGPLRQDRRQPDAGGAARLPALARAAPRRPCRNLLDEPDQQAGRAGPTREIARAG